MSTSRRMRSWVAAAILILLGACASTRTDRITPVFKDQLFAAPVERIGADQVFALSDPMRHYLDSEIVPELRGKSAQQALFDALYSQGRLKLDYDSTMTRNAAQAFEAKSGNCLSLVILTAAFAKTLGLPVRFQTVYLDEDWSRNGGLDLLNEHVNVTLGPRKSPGHVGQFDEHELTIDFIPASNLAGRRTRVLTEASIIAMYMNNRAVEWLEQGQTDRAYWWAKAAISQDARYLPAYNTLGVVYKAHGDLADAETVFSWIHKVEPGNTIAMSNLVPVLVALGRDAEAEKVAAALKAIQPTPPFHFFDLGLAAMSRGDFAAARSNFAQEVQRDAYYDKFHFWLALAYYGLGDLDNAQKQMAIAMETSSTSGDRALYAEKLVRLRAGLRP
jgi:Tfp pilus assembly protein PilF